MKAMFEHISLGFIRLGDVYEVNNIKCNATPTFLYGTFDYAEI